MFPRKATVTIFKRFHDRHCLVSFSSFIVSQEYTNDVIVSLLEKIHDEEKHYIFKYEEWFIEGFHE